MFEKFFHHQREESRRMARRYAHLAMGFRRDAAADSPGSKWRGIHMDYATQAERERSGYLSHARGAS